MRKGKFVNTGNGDNQDNDRVNCLMNRNSIQDWGIRKFVSDSTVGEINVKTMLNQFEYVMTNTPINETVTSKILGRVSVRVATRPFRYLYILQRTLASTCKNKVTISVSYSYKKVIILMPSKFIFIIHYYAIIY